MIECQHENCENLAVYVVAKGPNYGLVYCHQHKPLWEELELTDQEWDRQAEEHLVDGRWRLG